MKIWRNRRNNILLLCCMLMLLSSCQETPEMEYVVNKEGQDKLIQEHEGEDQGILLAEQVKAPEYVDDVLSLDDKRSIRFHADVQIPAATTVPIYTVETMELNEDVLSQMASVLYDGEVYKVESEDEILPKSQLQRKKEVLEEDIEACENRIYKLGGGQSAGSEEELQDHQDSLERMRAELSETELLLYRIQQGEFEYLNHPADFSFDTKSAYAVTNDTSGAVRTYEYMENEVVGDRDGNTFLLRGIKANEITLVRYSLVDGASPIYQEYMPDEVEVDIGVGSDYRPNWTVSADTHCRYSLQEARELCVNTLRDLGFPDVSIVSEQNTSIRPVTGTNENLIPVGYTFFCSRGYDGMSDIHYQKGEIAYYEGEEYQAFLNHAYYDDRTLMDVNLNTQGAYLVAEYWNVGMKEMLNSYDVKQEIYIPVTNRELFFVVITDYGVTRLDIINPKKTQSMQAEHVALMDFTQVFEQGKAVLAAKYTDRRIYNEREDGFSIDHIVLSYAMMQSPYTEGEYTMIPVWDFMTEDGNVILTLNAIDGSTFDRDRLH